MGEAKRCCTRMSGRTTRCSMCVLNLSRDTRQSTSWVGSRMSERTDAARDRRSNSSVARDVWTPAIRCVDSGDMMCGDCKYNRCKRGLGTSTVTSPARAVVAMRTTRLSPREGTANIPGVQKHPLYVDAQRPKISRPITRRCTTPRRRMPRGRPGDAPAVSCVIQVDDLGRISITPAPRP